MKRRTLKEIAESYPLITAQTQTTTATDFRKLFAFEAQLEGYTQADIGWFLGKERSVAAYYKKCVLKDPEYYASIVDFTLSSESNANRIKRFLMAKVG